MSRSSGASARIFKTLVDPLSRGQTDVVTAAGGGGGEREGVGGCRAWPGGRVHVGAGFHAPANERAYRRVIRRACLAAAAILREGGGTSLNAVADAIRVLEDDPITNAGRGSSLTQSGRIKCDASIMDVAIGSRGAVEALQGVRNPIQVALHLAKEQMSGSSLLGRIPPMFLVGEGACQWAKCKGIAIMGATLEENNWLVTGNAKAQWVKYSVLLASTKESVNRSTASGSESSSIQFDPSVEETGIVVQDLFLQQNRTNFETNEPLSDQQPGK